MIPERSDEIPQTNFTPEELGTRHTVLQFIAHQPALLTSPEPEIERVHILAVRLLNAIRDHNKALRKKADLALLNTTGIRRTRAARAVRATPQGIAAHEMPRPVE